jgi:hypothetical protein
MVVLVSRQERPLLDAPTDPGAELSCTGLPPWVFDGKAPILPWVKDTRLEEIVVGQLRDSFHVQPSF